MLTSQHLYESETFAFAKYFYNHLMKKKKIKTKKSLPLFQDKHMFSKGYQFLELVSCHSLGITFT